jgi:hypothetical protein
VSHRCLLPDELVSVRELDTADPRRREVEACPRCHALLLSFDEFLDDRSVPEGVDLEAARRLDAAFEREQVSERARPAATERAAEPVPIRRSPRGERAARRWTARWLAPGARLAWAAVAAVVVVGAYTALRQWPGYRGEDVLRSAPDSTAVAAGERFRLLEPRVLSQGVELSWTSVPGADAYRVVLLNPDLAEVGSLGPLADTTVILTPERRPQGWGPGSAVGWQVEALQAGHRLASSEAATLQLP